MRHSFILLLSDSGVPIENIARLVGHAGGSAVTETVHRKQIRPRAPGGRRGDGPNLPWHSRHVDAQLDAHSPRRPSPERGRGPVSLEPPIGIEPMTYSLRVRSPGIPGSPAQSSEQVRSLTVLNGTQRNCPVLSRKLSRPHVWPPHRDHRG